MSQIRRILHVKDPLYISPIDYVQSSTLVPIAFELFDFELTDQMGAAVLVIRPDKTFEYDPAEIDISTNTITVQPTSTTFAVPGSNYLQVRIYGGEQQIQIAFDVLVRVTRDGGALTNIGVNIVPFVDQILAVNTEAEQSAAAAETAAEYAEELIRKLEYDVSVSIPVNEWSGTPPTASITIPTSSGVVPADAKIVNVSLQSGDISDYMKVESVEIVSQNTLRFSACDLPEDDLTLIVTHI